MLSNSDALASALVLKFGRDAHRVAMEQVRRSLRTHGGTPSVWTAVAAKVAGDNRRAGLAAKLYRSLRAGYRKNSPPLLRVDAVLYTKEFTEKGNPLSVQPAGTQMPPSMIEQVARLLCNQAGLPEDTMHDGREIWLDFVPEARAVVAAMSEPTAAMASAVGGSLPDEAAYCWRVMIAAALNES